MARVRHVALSLLGVITFAVALTAQSPIRYIYDELGRLVGVIDASGDAAAYLERLRWEIGDFENGELHFLCESIRVIAATLIGETLG